MSNKIKFMILLVILLALISAVLTYLVLSTKNDLDYETLRANFLKREESRMIGSDLTLEDNEVVANKILMKFKFEEIDAAYKDPSKHPFLPSQNFLQAADKIRNSTVFKIIQLMPKGSVLHAHNKAMVSVDYVINNITRHPKLYVCGANDLRLKFFDKPDNYCNWTRFSEFRINDVDLDTRIRKSLMMKDNDCKTDNSDFDAVWNDFQSVFEFLSPLLKYKETYEEHLYRLLYESYNDNIQYLELRTALGRLYDLNGTKYNITEVAKITQNVVEKFTKDHQDFLGVKLIYSPSRKQTDLKLHLNIMRELKRQFPDFVVGFDLVGQEDKGNTLVEFAKELREIGNGVQLFLHAGETNWYGTSTDENLIDAVLLNTKRIGHGFALTKHPEVLELVRKKDIAIEILPISNQVLYLVDDLRNHPAAALFADNYPIVVSNDDPSFWKATGLSYDFYEAFMGIMSRKADLRALKKLALNSIEYSCMDDVLKKKAVKIWSGRWKKFVDDLVKSRF